MALVAEETNEAPVGDLTLLTLAEEEEAERLAVLIDDDGLPSLSDDDLALAECLRCKLDGREDGACLG